jgi:hypothetical protein
LFKSLLNKHGIQGGSLYVPKNKNYARLSFSTNSGLALANKMYRNNTCLQLKRKREQIDIFRSRFEVVKSD